MAIHKPYAPNQAPGLTHEVLSGVYDYEHQPTSERGIIGSLALLMSRTPAQGEARAVAWRSALSRWRERLRADKPPDQASAAQESLAAMSISQADLPANTKSPTSTNAEAPVIPQQRQPSPSEVLQGEPEHDQLAEPSALQPQRIRREQGLYRSVHAQDTTEPPHHANSMDPQTAEVLQRAVDTVKTQLAQSNTPTTTLPANPPSQHKPVNQPTHDTTRT